MRSTPFSSLALVCWSLWPFVTQAFFSPTGLPTADPTYSPSISTSSPTSVPSTVPTLLPSGSPTSEPTYFPTYTKSPSISPSSVPSVAPSLASQGPTVVPSVPPSSVPSISPSQASPSLFWLTYSCTDPLSPVSVDLRFFACVNTSDSAGLSSLRRYRNYSGDSLVYPTGNISVGTLLFSTADCSGASVGASSTDYPLYCQGSNSYAYNSSSATLPLSDYYGVVAEYSGGNCSQSEATSLQLIQVSAMESCHLDSDLGTYATITSCAQSSSSSFTFQAEVFGRNDSTCSGPFSVVSQSVSSQCSPVNGSASFQQRLCTHAGPLASPPPTHAPVFAPEPSYLMSGSCSGMVSPYFVNFTFFSCVNTSTSGTNSSFRRDIGGSPMYNTNFITVYTLSYATNDCTGPFVVTSTDNTSYPAYCTGQTSNFYFVSYYLEPLTFPYFYSITYEYGQAGCSSSDLVGAQLYFPYTFQFCRYDPTYGTYLTIASCNQTSSSLIEYTLQLYRSNDTYCQGAFSTAVRNETAGCVAANSSSSGTRAFQQRVCLYQPYTPPPSPSPTAFPTFSPSSAPSGAPSLKPTFSPSFASSNASLAPSSSPSQIPTFIPSFVPSATPTTSYPSRIPSTSAPTLYPTINVSALAQAPSINVISAVATNASIILSVTIASSLGVNLYCAAFDGTYTLVSPYQVMVGVSVSVPQPSNSKSIAYTVTDLLALHAYDVYCAVQTWSGTLTPLSIVLASKMHISTSCCKEIVFVSAPSVIDPRSTDTSTRIFTFALPSAPSSSVQISPLISSAGASKISTSPASFVFTVNSTSLKGSFILSTLPSGSYSVSLVLSGNSYREYSSSVASFQILASDAPIPGPSMLSAIFTTDGGSAVVTFSRATNQGGIIAPKWPCSRIFNFTSAAACTCIWVNSSSAKMSFPALSQLPLLSPGGSVELLPDVLAANCLTGVTCLPSPAQIVQATAPASLIAPVVLFNVPSTASTCDDLTIDASPSYGNGGRDYSAVSWTFSSSSSSANVSEVLALLPNTTRLLSAPVKIPKNLLVAGTMTFTLSLRNFLGQSGAATAVVYVIAGKAIPTVSILGSYNVIMKASAALSVQTKTTPSACATSSTVIYAWTVLLGNVIVPVTSTSLNPSAFRANPYTFTTGNQYEIQVNASTLDGGYAISLMHVYIAPGQIVAIISGSSIVSVAIDRAFELDASSSYDENYPTSSLTYSWSCLIVSLLNYGSDCTSATIGRGNSSKLEIPALSLTLNVTYSFTVNILSADGRSADASVTVTPAPPGAPAAVVTVPFKARYNVKDTLTFTGTILSGVPTTAYWTISNTGPAYDLISSAYTPTFRQFSYYAPSGIAYPLVLAPYTTSAGVTYTVTLHVFITSDPQLLASASTDISISAPPTSGTIIVSPTSGEALVTEFTLSAPGW